MYAKWFIALVVSGGVAGWIYGKLHRRNGNQKDTLIACAIIWFLGFFILFSVLKHLNI